MPAIGPAGATMPPMRIAVRGTSGSGKSTVGRAAAERLGVPFVELDGIRHLPAWQELPDDEFRARVAEVVAGDGWVVDGNYSVVRPTVDARATHVVWLDLPRWLTVAQVVRRSIGRVVLRRRLWNGNRERWRNLLSLDPLESIVVWTWTTHGRRRREFEAMLDERWVRLRSRREIAAWLRSLERV